MKFTTNQERLAHLRETLEKPYELSGSRNVAVRLAFEWVKTGVFGVGEFIQVLDMTEICGYREREIDEQEK